MKPRMVHTARPTPFTSAISASRALSSRVLSAFSLLSMLCGMFAVASAQKTVPDFGKVPLSFEPNRGQTDAQVQFLSRGPGYTLFLTPGEAVLSLEKSKVASSTLRMQVLGANRAAAATGGESLAGTANYFEGTDKSKWKTAIPTYKRVSYSAIYPGVDLVYYGSQRQLEYDFVVAPGADPNRIALGFTGTLPKIDRASGDLVLKVEGGETRFHKPVIYQFDGGRKIPVAGSYTVAKNQVHFALGSYDKSKTLIIDPVLSYMTYLGGSSNDLLNGMAVDSQGNAIVIGTTLSADFPLKNAADSKVPLDDRTPNMFVTKFNATGTAIVYSTYLGLSTSGNAIAVDPLGNAYAFGSTNDPNYPVTSGAFQTICGANNNQGQRVTGCANTVATGNNSTVLTKISPDGSQLVYSTYLSGNNSNTARAIAVNAAGEAYVTGITNAFCPAPPYNANGTGYQAYDCFPVTANAAESSVATTDTYAFLTKFNAQGSGLVYSTVLRNHNPVGHYLSTLLINAIALDAADNAYVTGHMDANYFITTTPGSFKPTRSNGASLPAFVAKFDPAGTSTTSLVYSTYLTGTTDSNDSAYGIAVDNAGNAVVTGYTNSCTFPTTAGAFSTVPGGYVDSNICSGGFLTKLNAGGSGLVWSTYTGNNGAKGRNNDNNDAVALGADGTVYVAGDEIGVALSPTVNPILVQQESHFTYIKQFTADGSQITFSSAVGGTTDATSIPASIVVDAANNIYLAGYTNSPTWPVTPGAFQTTNKSSSNGFVVKIAPTSPTTTVLTLPAGTVSSGQSVNFTAKVTGATGSTGTPTGTVTFLSGSTTLGTGTLDATGTATYTAASLNATTYTITASYAGDNAFSASISPAQTLLVSAAAPTVTLTAPATAPVGASVTFAANVSGTAGTPTGTVIFKEGTTTLGMATLSSGAASFSTSTLAAGAHSITASYSGDSLYTATVSAAVTVTINVNVAPAISFAAVPSSLTIVHGASGSIVITGTPVGGYTGTVTFACGTLPTAATCVFAPASLSFTGNNTPQSSTLTVSTLTTAALEEPGFGRSTPGIFAAILLLPLGFLVRGRRSGTWKGLLLLVALAASIGVMGTTGCGNSGTSKTSTTTPAGTYSIPVTITAAGGVATTLTIPVTVQ